MACATATPAGTRRIALQTGPVSATLHDTGLAEGGYSSELNPVENIWQFLRQNRLANRVFENYDAIVDACSDAWNALIALPEQIASITAREWAQVNT